MSDNAMFQVSTYGRLGGDPRAIDTSSGKAMAVGSLAVEVGERKCAQCGKSMPNRKRRDAAFCGAVCRARFNREKKKAEQKRSTGPVLHPDVLWPCRWDQE